MSIFKFLRKAATLPVLAKEVVKEAAPAIDRAAQLSAARQESIRKWRLAGAAKRKGGQNVFRAGEHFDIQAYDPYVGLSVTRKRKEARDWQRIQGGRFLRYKLHPKAKILRFKDIPKHLLSKEQYMLGNKKFTNWMPKDTTMRELNRYAYSKGYDAVDLEKIYGIKELRILKLGAVGL